MSYTPVDSFASVFGSESDAPVMADAAGSPTAKLSGINVALQELIAQVKPGMTREQVRFILGTPLLTDIFHADRWDYVYWRETQDGRREQRKIALFFADGKVARVEGDLVSPAAGR